MRQNTAAIIETMQQTKFFLRKNIISEIILTTQVKKSQKVEDEDEESHTFLATEKRNSATYYSALG